MSGKIFYVEENSDDHAYKDKNTAIEMRLDELAMDGEPFPVNVVISEMQVEQPKPQRKWAESALEGLLEKIDETKYCGEDSTDPFDDIRMLQAAEDFVKKVCKFYPSCFVSENGNKHVINVKEWRNKNGLDKEAAKNC